MRRAGITRTGNAHLRRILAEAAWAYRHRPSIGPTLRRRRQGLSQDVIAIADKAHRRLHGRYRRLIARGKPAPKAMTAVGRELLGFIWHIATTIERRHSA